MSASMPVEKIMNVSDTKQQLSRVVNSVARGETRVVVEKSGLPVVAIISIEEYRRLQSNDESRSIRRQRLADAFASFSDGFNDVSDPEIDQVLAELKKEIRVEKGAERAVSGSS